MMCGAIPFWLVQRLFSPATVSACILLLVPSAMCQDDSLALVKAAYDQYEVSCQSGRMHFLRQVKFHWGLDTTLEGNVEWDTGYMFFDGVGRHVVKASQAADKEGAAPQELDSGEHRVRFLELGDSFVCRLDRLDPPTPGKRAVLVYQDFVSRRRKSPADRFRPDLELYLQSLSFVSTQQYYNVVSQKPETTGGIPFERRTESFGLMFVVHREFGHGLKDSAKFDLEHSGLCVELLAFREDKKGGQYDLTTREWAKSESGRWYPAMTRSEVRAGSPSAAPAGSFEMAITGFLPLTRRTHSGGVRVDTFGPLPPGTYIERPGPDGKQVGKIIPVPPVDLVDQFRSLAQRLRKSGFAAAAEGGDP